MINWSDIERYGEKLHLSSKQIDSLRETFNALDMDFFEEFVNSHAEKNFTEAEVKEHFSCDIEMQRFLLLSIIASYPEFEEFYRKSGYPEKMFDEISHDLAVWQKKMEDDYGTSCLDWRIYCWCRSVVKGEILQFGRLQLNLCNYPFEHSIYRRSNNAIDVKFECCTDPRPDLTYGDKILNFHIPASGPLDIDSCKASLKEMAAFFKKYRPDYDYKAICVFSWLLDPVYQKILNPQSNIAKFQQLGHLFVIDGIDSTSETIWRLWDRRTRDTGLCRENHPVLTSSIQKAVAEYIFNGGQMMEGAMIFFPDEIDGL